MANLVSTMYQAWRARVELSRHRNELATREIQGINRLLEQSSNVVDTSLEKGESLILGQNVDPNSLSEELDLHGLSVIRTQSRRLWFQNAHGHGSIRNLIKYVGIPTVVPKEDSDILRDYWKTWWVKNKMNKKWKEILRRSFRDGETFIRWFDDEKNENLTLTFRFINPSLISQPEGRPNASHGIECEDGDVESPLWYWKQKPGETSLGEDGYEQIDAEEVYHIKINVDSDVKRGRPYLEPVMRLILSHETWLRDRIILNKIRTAIALIKKIDAPRETVDRIRNAQAATGALAGERRQNIQKVPQPGSLLTATRTINYEFLSPKLDARDVKEDGRNILLAVTAGLGQSEVLVTGDASNQNFASSLVAEGPVAKEIEDWREFFDDDVQAIYSAVVAHAIEQGVLPDIVEIEEEIIDDDGNASIETRQVEVSGLAEVSWPQLTQRNIKQESEALAIHKAMGIVSKETLSAKAGYDPREERRKLRRDAKDSAKLRTELDDETVPTPEEEIEATEMKRREFEDRVIKTSVIQKKNGDEEDYDGD